MSHLISGLKVLQWCFAGLPSLTNIASQTAAAKAFAGLWGFLLAAAILVVALLFFPFFSASSPVWASPLLLLVSWVVMMVPLLLLQVLRRKIRVDLPGTLGISGPPLLVQALGLAGMVLVLNLVEQQELVAASLIGIQFSSSMWQAALLHTAMSEVLGIKSFATAILGGLICLLGFLAGCAFWLMEFASDELQWNSIFFI